MLFAKFGLASFIYCLFLQEEKEKARAQKEEVVTQVTEVLENELQCIICSELFIEVGLRVFKMISSFLICCIFIPTYKSLTLIGQKLDRTTSSKTEYSNYDTITILYTAVRQKTVIYNLCFFFEVLQKIDIKT